MSSGMAGPSGLSFPIGSMPPQYPPGLAQSNECHQLGYDLISQSHQHHASSFANSFSNANPATATHSAPFSDYGKQSEEYSKAMYTMATGGPEGHHHFGKALPTPNPVTGVDCYAKITAPEANNNWNQAYGTVNSAAGVPPGSYDYSHQYGITHF